MIENEFVDIPGYEGIYQVNIAGEFRRLDRVLRNRWGNYIKRGGAINIYFNNYGYAVVPLSKGGVCKHIKVHLILARLFIPNIENKRTVNHKNGDKSDFRLENLEWATDSEQQKHAFRIGLQKPRIGKDNSRFGKIGKSLKWGDSPLSKLILDTEIGVFYHGTGEAAENKNMNRGTLRAMLNGRIKNKTNLIYA